MTDSPVVVSEGEDLDWPSPDDLPPDPAPAVLVARYYGNCTRCWSWISPGQEIERGPTGWRHAGPECPGLPLWLVGPVA